MKSEKELIEYIAWNWNQSAVEIGRELGMRASAVAEFMKVHDDEITAAIEEHVQQAQETRESAQSEETPEGLDQTRLGADITRMVEVCEAFCRYAKANRYPPIEWVEEIKDRAADVAKGLREEINTRDA